MHDLVVRAQQGDQRAEQEIFQSLHARFKLLATQMIDDDETAADLAQETCLTILEKYKTERFSVGFEAWAFGILKMKVRNYWRLRQVRRNVTAEQLACGANGAACYPSYDPGLERQLLVCLKKILAVNPRYARVLNFIYQGYDSPEICRRLQLARSNLYSILCRGRAMLKVCLSRGEV
jgi:RNA polymerase sigma factor (sigma-70 family)